MISQSRETVFNQPVFHEMDRGYFEWLRHAQATNWDSPANDMINLGGFGGFPENISLLLWIMFNQFWDISWYTSSRLEWFVGCFCVVSWQRQAWLHYSFLGTQATGKAMWKIRTRKELTPIFIILNLTRHDKHGCISGPNMSQLYTHCMQTYLNISVIRMHLLLNSGFMIWFVMILL